MVEVYTPFVMPMPWATHRKVCKPFAVDLVVVGYDFGVLIGTTAAPCGDCITSQTNVSMPSSARSIAAGSVTDALYEFNIVPGRSSCQIPAGRDCSRRYGVTNDPTWPEPPTRRIFIELCLQPSAVMVD